MGFNVIEENYITGEDIGFSERMIMLSDEAIQVFGPMHQVAKCIEELSELQRELAIMLQFKPDTGNMKKEIADVLITVCQVCTLFDFDGLQEAMTEKLDKLELAIKEEVRKSKGFTN